MTQKETQQEEPPVSCAPANRRRGGRLSVWASRLLTAVVVLASLAIAGTVAASVAAGAPPTGLSVALTDGRSQVQSDITVTYTATLTNQGAEPVSASLVLTVPAYVTISDAPGATIAKSDATWPVTVNPGKSVKQTAVARIGAIPKGELRVTSLISVYQGKVTTGVPIIRSADTNTIKGVTDPKTATSSAGTTAGHSSTTPIVWIVIAVVVLALVALGLVLVARKRRHQNRYSQNKQRQNRQRENKQRENGYRAPADAVDDGSGGE